MIEALKTRLNIPYTVQHSKKFRVYPHMVSQDQCWQMRQGKWEHAEVSAMRLVGDRRLPIVEVGGGFGWTGVRLLDDFPGFHSIEPHPVALRIMREQMQLNGVEYETTQAAIGYGKDGLEISHKAKGLARKDLEAMRGRDSWVPLKPLADFITAPCNLLMDPEGAEWEIIHEELDLLERFVKGLVVDFTPPKIGGSGINKCVALLEKAGFKRRFMANNVVGFRHA